MKYFIEGLSTFILLIFGFLALSYGANYFGVLGSASIFAFTFGLLYYIFKKRFNIYLNPLFAFADALRKKISAKSFWLYLLAEFLASFVAALVMFLLVLCTAQGASIIKSAKWACSYNSVSIVGLASIGAVIFEIVIGFAFVVLFLMICARCANSKTRVLYLSLLVAVFMICTYNITFSAANPAKAFGPAIAYMFIGEFGLIVQFLVVCIAEFIGALIGYFVYKKFYYKKRSKSRQTLKSTDRRNKSASASSKRASQNSK